MNVQTCTIFEIFRVYLRGCLCAQSVIGERRSSHVCRNRCSPRKANSPESTFNEVGSKSCDKASEKTSICLQDLWQAFGCWGGRIYVAFQNSQLLRWLYLLASTMSDVRERWGDDTYKDFARCRYRQPKSSRAPRVFSGLIDLWSSMTCRNKTHTRAHGSLVICGRVHMLQMIRKCT